MTITTLKPFHPGHYLQSKASNSSATSDLELALQQGFVGALVDLPWAQLEPRPGQYDFTILIEYLRWAEKNNRRLIGMVFDRDFKAGCGKSKTVPGWVDCAPFNAKRANRGCIAKIWAPAVNNRRIALIEAIAAQFDGHPNLEALALPETALGGITPQSQPGYTREGYRDEIIRLIHAVAPALKQTMLFQSMNWLGPDDGSYLDMIAQAFVETGVGGITNPDSLWWEKKPMYGTMQRYAGRIPIMVGGDVSQLLDPDNNKHYKGVGELVGGQYRFAVEELGGNYVLWNPWFVNPNSPSGTHSAAYRAAIARLVADERNATVTAVPAVLRPAPGGEEPETPAPTIDIAAIQAWLKEADDLPAQVAAWLARGKALVG